MSNGSLGRHCSGSDRVLLKPPWKHANTAANVSRKRLAANNMSKGNLGRRCPQSNHVNLKLPWEDAEIEAKGVNAESCCCKRVKEEPCCFKHVKREPWQTLPPKRPCPFEASLETCRNRAQNRRKKDQAPNYLFTILLR